MRIIWTSHPVFEPRRSYAAPIPRRCGPHGPSSGPSRADPVLVNSTAYDAAGRTECTTDPRGIVNKTCDDALGRTTKTVEAYTDGTPSTNDDKTTEFTYDGMNHMLTLKAYLTSSTYQKTEWVYGVTTASGSTLNSNDLLKEMKYPDKSTGDPSTSEKESYTVNALGEKLTFTDRNGSVHTITFDVLGRPIGDAVTTLGSGVDGTVRRMETAYDTAGRPYLFTSYDAASGGNVVNQVQREFNGLGQLTKEYQSHSGTVNTGTTLKTQYAWSEMTSGANHSRLTSMTYSSGYVLNYNYSSGLNSNISRLSSLSDSTGTLESLDYRGLSDVVRRAHPQPGVDLTFIKQSGESNGDAGDQYTGHDRFGRIEDLRWLKTSNGTHTDRFKYGHDRNGNRRYRENAVDTVFSELYEYDPLDQLTDFQRGTLNGTKDAITGTPSRTQEWAHDALGNFTTQTTDGTAQNRTHNKQNQVTGVGSATLTFDANGNLKTDETGQQYKYDAWNRLVEVKDSGSTVLATYKYDALGHRVVETRSGVTTDLYYSDQWQVLEEREGTLVRARHVWSPVYIDALVLRDRDVNGDGTLEERLWVQQDANWNVTALLDGSGSVVERYVYDPFGAVTFLAPNWTGRSSSSYGQVYLFQGGRQDSGLESVLLRERVLLVRLGRFAQSDPLGIGAGDVNFYRFVSNTPTNATDPFGLAYYRQSYWQEKAWKLIADHLATLPRNASLADVSIARNRIITALYAQMYLDHPDLFPWLGLAALASDGVGSAMILLRSLAYQSVINNGLFGLPACGGLATVHIPLADGNKAVFLDIYWQVLAYTTQEAQKPGSGLAQMKMLLDRHELSPLEYEIWKLIAKGDAASVWEGNRLLFLHEQRDILQPYWDRLPFVPFVFSTGAQFVQMATPLFEGATTPAGAGAQDLSNFNDRWNKWINRFLWPEWQAHSTDPAKCGNTIDKIKVLANPNR